MRFEPNAHPISHACFLLGKPSTGVLTEKGSLRRLLKKTKFIPNLAPLAPQHEDFLLVLETMAPISSLLARSHFGI